MIPDHPLAVRYVDKLSQALGGLAPTERAEILTEIRNHISDATAAGTPIEEVLRALGPAEQLARGYRVELLLNPKMPTPRSDRWLKIVGLLALGSLPTLIIVVTLSSVGVSLAVSGVLVFIAGIVKASGEAPAWLTMDVPPWVAIVLIGPALTALGVAALWGLVVYVRFLARLVRRVLPAQQPA
ncbi:MAG: DUF1700 domain-containing protein [Betaproteobacteria bacterium]